MYQNTLDNKNHSQIVNEEGFLYKAQARRPVLERMLLISSKHPRITEILDPSAPRNRRKTIALG